MTKHLEATINMTDYILIAILIMMLSIVILMFDIRRKLIEIKFHLTGIQTKDIVSIGQKPRILTRSDEDEYNISTARKTESEED